MPEHELPTRPNLEHLKKQARLLHREFLQGEPAARERFGRSGGAAAPKLADALHVIACEYGFDNWAKLKSHVGSLSEDPKDGTSESQQHLTNVFR